MNVAIGVVTTARRKAQLDETMEALGEPAPRVFCDLEPGLTPNHRAAWRELFKQADRALLLQDDALPCRNWREAVSIIADQFPDAPVVNLFSARAVTRTLKARLRGYAVEPGIKLMYDLALLFTRDAYQDFDAWVDERHYNRVAATVFQKAYSDEELFRHHDGLVRLWLYDRGWKEILSAPPIFQHVGVESTIGHAWKVFGRERSSPDWPGRDFDAAEHFASVFGRGEA